MSKCDVSIELAHQGERSTGESVEGHVVVVVDEDVRANHVEIELGWITHGRGNRVSRTVEKMRIEGGAWSAGRTLRLPFRFSVPAPGPVTHRGTLINLDWQVKARVDLPWALDPKASEDFVVVAGPQAMPLLESDSVVTGGPPSKVAAGCITAFCVPFVLTGGGALLGGVVTLNPFVALFGLIFLGVPSVLLFVVWRGVLAHSAVGNVILQLMTDQAKGGDDVTFALELPERVAPKIVSVTAKLEGGESAVSGSGTRRTTHTDTFYTSDVALTKGAGATGPRYEGRVRLPDGAKTTLRLSDNTVIWQVKVAASIDGQADPSWAREIVVVPSPMGARPKSVSVPTARTQELEPRGSTVRREPGPGHIGRCPVCDDVFVAPVQGHGEQDCTFCGGTFLGAGAVEHYVLAVSVNIVVG